MSITSDHDETLTELRIAVARLDERTIKILERLDQAVVSRTHLEERLAPITENLNRWKGALTLIVIVAGSISAAVTIFIKNILVRT